MTSNNRNFTKQEIMDVLELEKLANKVFDLLEYHMELTADLEHMPEDTRARLRAALEKSTSPGEAFPILEHYAEKTNMLYGMPKGIKHTFRVNLTAGSAKWRIVADTYRAVKSRPHKT